MKARVGMITQWYDPERGSAAQPGVISRSLQRRGHVVDVLTGFPNYPTGVVYPGYKVRPYAQEEISGITVHRAPLYPSHDTNAARRAANYLSFAASASAIALAKLGSVDAALVHSTPATTAIPAVALRALRRVPFVVHIQDLWPQTVVSSGFLEEQSAGKVERALHFFCDRVYRYATTVAVTSPGMAELIARRGVDERKIAFVPNWSDESTFKPVERSPQLAEELGIHAPFNVMYAGNLGDLQGLDTFVEAAVLLRSVPEIGFVLVGDGVAGARLRQTVKERALSNVRFVEPQPFDQMARILALGDVQLVSLQDLPLFRTTLPSKLQATMAAGRPILGAVTGDAAAAIRESGSGVVVQPGSATEMAAAIRDLHASRTTLKALGQAGRDYYRQNYSEQVAGDHLSELLSHAAAVGRKQRP